MRPPIHTEPDSGILARVAIQLVKRALLKPQTEGYSPSSLVYFTSAALPKDGFTDLRFALHSLAAHLGMGVLSHVWLKEVRYRASQGGVFRWHFFGLYKSNRNPYPRVTNRGVQTSLGAQHGLVSWSPDDD